MGGDQNETVRALFAVLIGGRWIFTGEEACDRSGLLQNKKHNNQNHHNDQQNFQGRTLLRRWNGFPRTWRRCEPPSEDLCRHCRILPQPIGQTIRYLGLEISSYQINRLPG